MNRTLLCLFAAALATLSVACESTKSSNPLSPTLAGPIPGVNITPPRLLEPGQGWEFETAKQPITLLIENASSNGVRPLFYEFEVATDAAFTKKVFSRANVPQGPNGRTSLRLPENLPSGKRYYWRAKAQDGANHGPFTAAVSFEVIVPVVIKAPGLMSPVGGRQASSVDPVLTFRNAATSGPVGAISYRIELALDSGFARLLKATTTREDSGSTTSFRVNVNLPEGRRIFWRVRAFDSKNQGPWSGARSFTSSVTNDPGSGPSPPVGSCASTNPKFIIDCVARKYPSRLKAGVSLSTRKTNMGFLRDRIIEAGLCGGTEMGWNMKRGGPEKSIDYMVHVKGGDPWGVDIAIDYDNTSKPIRLVWNVDKITPHYRPYSNSYSCK